MAVRRDESQVDGAVQGGFNEQSSDLWVRAERSLFGGASTEDGSEPNGKDCDIVTLLQTFSKSPDVRQQFCH